MGWPLERWFREIYQRCADRTAYPRGACRGLLAELRESGLFWLTLRKHLTVRDTEYALRVLQEHVVDGKKWKGLRMKYSGNNISNSFDDSKHFDNWMVVSLWVWKKQLLVNISSWCLEESDLELGGVRNPFLNGKLRNLRSYPPGFESPGPNDQKEKWLVDLHKFYSK